LTEYSLRDLLYTLNKLTLSKNVEEKKLKIRIENHLKLKTQDKEIGKLRHCDIEEYVSEYENELIQIEKKVIQENKEVIVRLKNNSYVKVSELAIIEMD